MLQGTVTRQSTITKQRNRKEAPRRRLLLWLSEMIHSSGIRRPIEKREKQGDERDEGERSVSAHSRFQLLSE
jgi:hypothetical protein